MVTDPGDRVGQPSDRVVGVDLGAVTGAAVRHQAQPGDALLGGLHQIRPAAGQVDREPPHLADRLGDAVQQVGVVTDDVPGPVLAATLLVGGEGEDEVACWHAA